MTKVKIFEGRAEDVQLEANEWLDANPDVVVKHISTSTPDTPVSVRLYLTIVYETAA